MDKTINQISGQPCEENFTDCSQQLRGRFPAKNTGRGPAFRSNLFFAKRQAKKRISTSIPNALTFASIETPFMN